MNAATLTAPAERGTASVPFKLFGQRLFGTAYHDRNRWIEVLIRPTNGESAQRVVHRARLRRRGAELDAAVMQGVLSWLELADEDIGRVSVNLTVDTLARSWCVDALLAMIGAWRVAPQKLCFELPETVAAPSTHLLESVKRLRDAGCIIALDDVGIDGHAAQWCGTGVVDVVKMDASLLRNALTGHPHARHVLESFVILADRIGAEPVIEGVEDKEGAAIAAHMATLCQRLVIQGFHVSSVRPLWAAAGGESGAAA